MSSELLGGLREVDWTRLKTIAMLPASTAVVLLFRLPRSHIVGSGRGKNTVLKRALWPRKAGFVCVQHHLRYRQLVVP